MASEGLPSSGVGGWPDDVQVAGSAVVAPDPMILNAIGLNYALEAAVADLVDNSLDAGASNVLVRFIRRGPRLVSLCIVDDGLGMDGDQLHDAMALGKRRDYGPNDLGHFGLGLKAASLGPGTESDRDQPSLRLTPMRDAMVEGQRRPGLHV